MSKQDEAFEQILECGFNAWWDANFRTANVMSAWRAAFAAGREAGKQEEQERVLAIVREVGKMRARSEAVNVDWVAGVNAGTEQSALEITRRIKEQE